MPQYLYCCPKCDRHFEVTQSITAKPYELCTVCRNPIHRVPQKPAVSFKGSGFYVTDTPGAKKPL